MTSNIIMYKRCRWVYTILLRLLDLSLTDQYKFLFLSADQVY